MARPSGADGPHVIVADTARPELDDPDRRHLTASLRLRVGDPLTVTDGAGRWRRCVLTAHGLEAIDEIEVVDAPQPALTVALALTKAAKPELAVQKLTELGVDHIVVFSADRSIPRWDDAKARKQQGRLERVVREALMQSRGVRLPTVATGVEFTTISTGPGVGLADAGGDPITLDDTTVLVGPEGGWSDAERARVGRRIGLGPAILRAETAAIAVATLMTGLRSGSIAPARGRWHGQDHSL